MQSVLLLNSSYEPLRVVPWQRAVTLVFGGKVEIVEEYDHHIRSISLVIRAPAVIRLLKYTRVGRKEPPLCRANLLARDNFECQYCSRDLSSKEATLDHVIPRSRGGRTSWENIVVACAPCNRKKGGRTPSEAHMPLRRKPTKPDWLPVLSVRFRGSIPEVWISFLGLATQRS